MVASARGERRDRLAGAQGADRAVRVADGIPIHFEASFRNGDDPVLRDAAACVEPLLDGPVTGQRVVGHLDDEQRRGRVRIQVVELVALHDRNVRFRLRVAARRQRHLDAHVTAAAERAAEQSGGTRGYGGVPTALRRHREDFAIDQLDPVVRTENASLDRAVVGLPAPAVGPGCGVGHLCRLTLRACR